MENEDQKDREERRARPRMYRSRDDSMIAGVAGGASEYLGTDSAFLRVVGVFLTLATGVIPGVLAYLLAVALIPKDRDRRSA